MNTPKLKSYCQYEWASLCQSLCRISFSLGDWYLSQVPHSACFFGCLSTCNTAQGFSQADRRSSMQKANWLMFSPLNWHSICFKIITNFDDFYTKVFSESLLISLIVAFFFQILILLPFYYFSLKTYRPENS